jgi:hypothetical protein
VLLIAGDGVQLTANEFGRRTATGGLENNVALVETCSDVHLCRSTNVFMKANSGFSAVTTGAGGSGVLANRGMVRLLPTAQPFNGGPGFHTWVRRLSSVPPCPFRFPLASSR